MQKQEAIKGSVLYFPHIEVNDADWLKGALCIWDTVYRIVPEGYNPQDSHDVREAVDAGVLKNIDLSVKDLQETREQYHDFLASVAYLPDALDRPPRGTVEIHHEKLDERMIAELTDVLGVITRNGDWLELPRGLADGYMLFLATTVAKRRAMPKLTDSDFMFVSMQYFSMQGDMDEFVFPGEGRADMSAALFLQTFAPAGIEDQPMKKVLQFHLANAEGRQAFRSGLDGLAQELSKVEDQKYVREIVDSYMKRLHESEGLTLARLREYFAQRQPILLGLGVPLAVSAFKDFVDSHDTTMTLGKVGIAIISGLAGAVKDCRKGWVTTDASYLARLRENFVGDSPFPRRMRRLDKMMDEFLND